MDHMVSYLDVEYYDGIVSAYIYYLLQELEDDTFPHASQEETQGEIRREARLTEHQQGEEVELRMALMQREEEAKQNVEQQVENDEAAARRAAEKKLQDDPAAALAAKSVPVEKNGVHKSNPALLAGSSTAPITERGRRVIEMEKHNIGAAKTKRQRSPEASLGKNIGVEDATPTQKKPKQCAPKPESVVDGVDEMASSPRGGEPPRKKARTAVTVFFSDTGEPPDTSKYTQLGADDNRNKFNLNKDKAGVIGMSPLCYPICDSHQGT